MLNHKLLIVVTIVMSAGTLAYLYNPKINFDFETSTQNYTVSLENIDIQYQKDSTSPSVNLKAQNTFYEPTGLVLKNIQSHLQSADRLPLTLRADEGFWPHHSEEIFLFGHVTVQQGSNSLLAHQLVIDLKDGTCYTNQEVTWSLGQIKASSPSLNEKINHIQTLLHTQESSHGPRN